MRFWGYNIQSIREQIAVNGFAFFSRLHTDMSGIDVAHTIGRSMALGGVAPLHRLMPKNTWESTPNSYSGIYGLDEFPLHTDLAHHPLPPRFFMLRCINGHLSVRTLLVDGYKLATEIGTSLLVRSLVQPRRPRNGRLPLLTIYTTKGDVGLLRWDEQFIKPASEAGKQGFLAFADALRKTMPVEFCLEKPGDTLVIDNWRMLHGRSVVPTNGKQRIIERIYLEEIG